MILATGISIQFELYYHSYFSERIENGFQWNPWKQPDMTLRVDMCNVQMEVRKWLLQEGKITTVSLTAWRSTQSPQIPGVRQVRHLKQKLNGSIHFYYFSISDSFSTANPLPKPIYKGTAVPHGHTFIIIGGMTIKRAQLDAIWKYNAEKERFEEVSNAKMRSERWEEYLGWSMKQLSDFFIFLGKELRPLLSPVKSSQSAITRGLPGWCMYGITFGIRCAAAAKPNLIWFCWIDVDYLDHLIRSTEIDNLRCQIVNKHRA